MRKLRSFVITFAFIFLTPLFAFAQSTQKDAAAEQRATLNGIEAGLDKAILHVSRETQFHAFVLAQPPRLVVELKNTEFSADTKELQGSGNYLKKIRASQYSGKPDFVSRVVLDLKEAVSYRTQWEGKNLVVSLLDLASRERRSPSSEKDRAKVAPASPAGAVESFFSESNKHLTKKVSLNLRNMELSKILRAISKQAGVSFILSRELHGKRFSAFLEQVTIQDALSALLESHGLGYEQIGNSDTFVVKDLKQTKVKTITRIFRLKYTQVSEPGSGASESQSAFTVVDSGAEKGGSSEQGGKEAGGGNGIVDVIRSMLTGEGRLQLHAQTNSLIVTDVPIVFPRIRMIIEKLDILIPQILIEAQIVEVDASFTRNLGLEIGGPNGELASLSGPGRLIGFPAGGGLRLHASKAELAGASIKDTSLFGSNPDLGMFFGKLSFEQLTVLLKAIESEGKGDFLARPKIMTLNNKSAEISITADTAIGIQSVTLDVKTGAATTTAERRTTGVSMRVTPQINDEDLVTLLIEPSVSRPQASEFFPTQFVDPQTRSLKTSVRVKNGETILIGGLLTNNKQKTIRRVPILGRIPLIGRLFRSEKTQTVKRELLIFITPKVIL